MSGGDSIRSLALTHGGDLTEDDIDDVQAISLIPDLHLRAAYHGVARISEGRLKARLSV